MSEGTIGFELRFSVRWARWILAAIFVVTQANELASESVTLTTYYPAPSGVYTQAITTSYSYFARDGGGVSIGTTNSTPAGDKLIVMNGNVGIGTTDPETELHINADGTNWSPAGSGGDFQIGNGTYRFEIGMATTDPDGGGLGAPGDTRLSVSGGSRKLILGSNNGASNTDTIVIDGQNNRVGVGTFAPFAPLDVAAGNGSIIARQAFGSGANQCAVKTYGNGIARCSDAPAAPCAATGCYVTLASGIYVNRWELGAETTQAASGGAGTMLCCYRSAGSAF